MCVCLVQNLSFHVCTLAPTYIYSDTHLNVSATRNFEVFIRIAWFGTVYASHLPRNDHDSSAIELLQLLQHVVETIVEYALLRACMRLYMYE